MLAFDRRGNPLGVCGNDDRVAEPRGLASDYTASLAAAGGIGPNGEARFGKMGRRARWDEGSLVVRRTG